MPARPSDMTQRPQSDLSSSHATGGLAGRRASISSADSCIGSAVANEGADVAFESGSFGHFRRAQAALVPLREGSTGATTSATTSAHTGSALDSVGDRILIDCSSSKGVTHAFTSSLALALGERGIRDHRVRRGPVRTPNIRCTMPADEVAHLGQEVGLARPGQPEELARAPVLLASDDGSFMTGRLVEVTGDELG